jgi:hypothetical protein
MRVASPGEMACWTSSAEATEAGREQIEREAPPACTTARLLPSGRYEAGEASRRINPGCVAQFRLAVHIRALSLPFVAVGLCPLCEQASTRN